MLMLEAKFTGDVLEQSAPTELLALDVWLSLACIFKLHTMSEQVLHLGFLVIVAKCCNDHT